jgi:hypothetical protein
MEEIGRSRSQSLQNAYTFGNRRRTIIDQSTAKFYKLRVKFLCRSRDARVFFRSEGGCMLGDGLLGLIEQFGRISGLERQRTLR